MSSSNKNFEFYKPTSKSDSPKLKAGELFPEMQAQPLPSEPKVEVEKEEKARYKPKPRQKTVIKNENLMTEEKSSNQVKTEVTTSVDTKKEPEYTPEELMVVFDELLFSGEYVEEFKIRNRLSIRLRTRTSKEIEKISREIDTMGANLYTTVEQKRSLLNLKYSLISYHSDDLSALKLEEREKFIDNLPGPIIFALVEALGKFDNKVYQACKEGEENF